MGMQSNISLNDNSCTWFTGCLSERRPLVELECHYVFFNLYWLKGVPQDSLLRFTTWCCLYFTNWHAHLYADDTVLIMLCWLNVAPVLQPTLLEKTASGFILDSVVACQMQTLKTFVILLWLTCYIWSYHFTTLHIFSQVLINEITYCFFFLK